MVYDLGELLMGCTALSTDPLLVWNYGVMAVISFIGGILFWFTFRKLDDEEEVLNNLDDGQFNGGEK
jgi:POT family proton-dependent oligopeptide transporter